MATKKQDSTGELQTTQKKKMKPRGGNSPVIGMNGYNLEPGDNTKIANVSIRLFNLPDIDMNDVEAVAERLTEYFSIYADADMKPTVAGMAIALNGHNRRWLQAVVTDSPLGGRGNYSTLRREVTDLIKKAYFMMENQWENYMNSGKLNPVTGIFLAKNNFGYQDKTEYVVTPNVQQENDYDPTSIRQRYMLEEKNDSDNDSDSDSGADSDS